MSDVAIMQPPMNAPAPSPAIEALDTEIKTRFARRTGSLDKFLNEWIKLDESQQMMFGAHGLNGENYFQYKLAHNDSEMALALARMCEFFAQSTDAEKVIGFLNQIDNSGNDIWHYLAGCLATNEDDDALTIAKILIQLEIDYVRKNDDDESALSKLLLPEVRWKSINSMNEVKRITIDEIENAFSDAVNANAAMKQEIVNNIFSSDLKDNEARLMTSIIGQAMAPQAERDVRDHAMKLMFEYIGGNRRENLFMKIAESEYGDLFDTCMNLLVSSAEYATREIMARDAQWAKAAQQSYFYKRLALRNRGRQNALMKAIIGDKPKHVGAIMGMFTNESLVLVKKNSRGETIKDDVTIDGESPAPNNPFLSYVLQLDGRGNTAFHTSVLLGREDCLRKLFHGLSLMDSYMIITRIPNKYGLVVADAIDPQRGLRKLAIELKAGRVQQQEAQQIAGMLKASKRDIKDYLQDVIARCEVVFERTGGLSEAKPTFDLKRIPTVAMHMQQLTARSAS